ncbi:hypothetical protein [Streptomyces sp. NPDC002403]
MRSRQRPEGGEAVRGAEGTHVVAGGSQGLSVEDDVQSGQTGENFEGVVIAKPDLYELVELRDPPV